MHISNITLSPKCTSLTTFRWSRSNWTARISNDKLHVTDLTTVPGDKSVTASNIWYSLSLQSIILNNLQDLLNFWEIQPEITSIPVFSLASSSNEWVRISDALSVFVACLNDNNCRTCSGHLFPPVQLNQQVSQVRFRLDKCFGVKREIVLPQIDIFSPLWWWLVEPVLLIFNSHA